jgi:hypothetical protein
MDKHDHDLVRTLMETGIPPDSPGSPGRADLFKRSSENCPDCRKEMEGWLAVSRAVRAGVRELQPSLPPLSGVVKANARRPSRLARISAAWSLIWAQRSALAGTGALPTAGLAIALGMLAAWILHSRGEVWLALPFFMLAPLLSGLAGAYLQALEADPVYEIVSATPTPPGALFFARLTLALGGLGGMLVLASWLIAALLNPSAGPPFAWSLIAAWLGPLLVLSALATLLSMIWGPLPASVVCLALWAGSLFQIIAELQGRPLFDLSLTALLTPDWQQVAGQVVLAGLLWLAAILILKRSHTGRLTEGVE